MHKSVLLKEIIDLLNVQPNDVVLDGTIGGGGHAYEICKSLGSNGMFIGFDRDMDAVNRVKEILSEYHCRIELINENFRNLDIVLDKLGIEKVDKILFDLGFSSFQIEESGRGFSFLRDEPLLMTFDKGISNTISAKEIVNNWAEESIADILYGFGGEKFSRRIAKKIIEKRKSEKINTSGQLVEIINESVPAWYRNGKIHPATKTFQALRIAVNDEFGAILEGVEKGIERLISCGKMAIISFHSSEDRIVKRLFREKEKKGVVKILTKKPIIPTTKELKENPRSRSAKIRVIKKI